MRLPLLRLHQIHEPEVEHTFLNVHAGHFDADAVAEAEAAAGALAFEGVAYLVVL